MISKNLTSVKNAPKKVLAKNWLRLFFNWQNSLFAKILLKVHFLFNSNLHFEISMKRWIMPHLPYMKKESFYLLEGTMHTFWELAGFCSSKMQETAQYFEKEVLYRQFKIVCHASKSWNFVKITGAYCAGFQTSLLCYSLRVAASRS